MTFESASSTTEKEESPSEWAKMDYYERLNVPRNASGTAIQEAFREMSKKFHPDVSGKDTSEIMQYISEAYSTLKDKKRREKYDEKSSQNSSRKSYSGSSSSRSEGRAYANYDDFVDELLKRMRAETEEKRRKLDAEIEELKRRFKEGGAEYSFNSKGSSASQKNKESARKNPTWEEQTPKKEKEGLKDVAAKEARNGHISYHIFIDSLKRESVPGVDDLINSSEVISAISDEAVKSINGNRNLYFYESYIERWLREKIPNFDRTRIDKSPKIEEALLNKARDIAGEGAYWFKSFFDDCEKYHLIDKRILLNDEKILKILRDKAREELSHGPFSFGLYLRQWREIGIEIEI